MPYDLSPPASADRKFRCHHCPAAAGCLVAGASVRDLGVWDEAVEGNVPVARAGKALVSAGSRADSVYVVRAGCLKSCTVDQEGQERVRSFFLSGDIIGLDTLGLDRHPADVIAIVPSQLCRIPKSRALALIERAPVLMQRLVERTSRDLAQALDLAGDFSADQRVAAFLLAIRSRLGSGAVLRLPMTRRDIANYLRLATETVCRVLGRFEARGLLVCADKTVHLVQPAGLESLAGSAAPAAALRKAA